MANEKKVPEKRTYTVDEIAAILGIGRTSAYKLARSGNFKIIRIGASMIRYNKGPVDKSKKYCRDPQGPDRTVNL